jgi:hypothetical protein
VERRQQLQETRSRFAAGEQERKQKLVLAMDLALHKMLTASATEITQVKSDREAGTKITTRVRPPNLRGVAALADVANKTAGLAIEGVNVKDFGQEERKVERVFWMKSPPPRGQAPSDLKAA